MGDTEDRRQCGKSLCSSTPHIFCVQVELEMKEKGNSLVSLPLFAFSIYFSTLLTILTLLLTSSLPYLPPQ